VAVKPSWRTVWVLVVTGSKRFMVAVARTCPPVSTSSRTVKPAGDVTNAVPGPVVNAGCSDQSSPAASAVW